MRPSVKLRLRGTPAHVDRATRMVLASCEAAGFKIISVSDHQKDWRGDRVKVAITVRTRWGADR